MSGDSNLQHHSNGRTRSRFFACLAATAALVAALWVALAGSDCNQCHAAGTLLSGIPLAWIGSFFYAALSAIAVCRGFSSWTRSGFLVASGVHVVLLGLLAHERIFCGGCLAAGAAAIAGAAASLTATPSSWRRSLATFCIAGLVTLGAVLAAGHAQLTQIALVKQKPADDAQSQPAKPGRVKLVVYEREGCKHCLEFEEQMLPQLRAALGETFDVERREAKVTMESPTIEVVGKDTRQDTRLFEGLPDYQELENAIRELR